MTSRPPLPSPADDRGSTLVVAIGALLVMSLLAALALKAATSSSDTSIADARSQQALQAAESGLQTAAYRLNMLQPAATRCVALAVEAPVSGTCSATTPEAMGNGASFSYRTTPALAAADPCAGLPVRAQTALAQRCITSVGTVDGVSRKLQARVAAYASTPLFPVAGIIGLDWVRLTGNIQIPDSTVATNGLLSATGNVRTGGTILGSSGGKFTDPSTTGNVTIDPISKRTASDGPIVLGPINPGTSATVNDNARIANGLRSPRVAPYDQISVTGTASYDPATRALRATGNSTITLGGGVYNFCSVAMTGNVELVVATGAKVSIYVDSPDNPNSGCPAGSGGFSVTGNFKSGTPPTSSSSLGSDPTALQLYVYGTNDGQGSITVTGNAELRAALYAPRSNVSITGNAKIIGGVAAKTVTMVGNGFQWDGRVGGLQAGSTGLYYRTAWRECPARTQAAAIGC
jgi:Tfp pilus assembly protein PilX